MLGLGVSMKKVPDWATAPFEEFLDFADSLDNVIRLSASGIAMMQAVPQAIKAIQKARGESSSSDTETKLNRAHKDAAFAASELAEGFPILHGQAAVALWSAVEALARNVLVAWLAHERATVLNRPHLSKLKISLVEYEQTSEQDRPEYLAETIERFLDAPLRSGVTRLDDYFALVGLDGRVAEDERRGLFELNNIRNVLVHRNAKADRRLLAACPWLTYKPGEAVKISRSTLNRYFTVTHSYVLERIQMLLEARGVGRYEPPGGGATPRDRAST